MNPNLSELQKKLLEMMDWFHHFCVDNNITYYAIGGTLLGAVRHQGFIPWDDDIDVGIPRDDYEKLIKLLSNGTHSHYLIETPYSEAPDYYYAYAKLYDTSTTLVEQKRTKCVRGAFIDIFPIDGVGTNLEERDKLFHKIDFYHMLFTARTCALRKDRSSYKNMAILLSRMIPSCILSEKKLSQKIDSLCASNAFSVSSYIGNLMGSYREKEIFPKDIFGEPSSYPFEGITIWGVAQADAYLTQIYGNWRKLPPKDKQKTAHDFIYLDLNRPYKTNN